MNILIIGASRGIGQELARQYSNLDHNVNITIRGKNYNVNENVTVFSEVDVTSFDSLQKLANSLDDKSIDLLIYNAGIWRDEVLGEQNDKSFLETFNTNAVGAFRVASLLKDKLKINGTLALMTSKMGSIGDNSSGGRYSYRMSKAAMNALGKSLSIDLKDRDIKVIMMHPGWVQTDMGGPNAHLTVEESVKGIINVIQKSAPKDSGKFFNYDGTVISW